jgi:hypothetical protein
MGLGRALHHPLGLAAVRIRAAALLPFLLLPLGACSTINAIVGAAAGAATGTATTNPLVGYGVAVGVNAGLDELQHYVARLRQNAEQDQIVGAVGEMQIGETRNWKIVHDIPEFDDEHGQMQVTRVIDTPLTQCKEVLFTVDEGQGAKLRRVLYTTDACHSLHGWKWAAAEPAVERWGYLQHISH